MTDYTRAEQVRPYKDALLFPATSIALAVEGAENPQCAGIEEAIDILTTLLLCMKVHGNIKAAIKTCARVLKNRTVDIHNNVFLSDVILAYMPDAVIRTRVREMTNQDMKSRKQMVRDGVWPAWMED